MILKEEQKEFLRQMMEDDEKAGLYSDQYPQLEEIMVASDSDEEVAYLNRLERRYEINPKYCIINDFHEHHFYIGNESKENLVAIVRRKVSPPN